MSLKRLVQVSCLLLVAGLISLIGRDATAQPGGYKCDRGTQWGCPTCQDLVAVPPASCRNATGSASIYVCIPDITTTCPVAYYVACNGDRWDKPCSQGGIFVGPCSYNKPSC